MSILKVKNWEEFQHYKDRNPPWIKLHRSLLTDYKFACLQDASKLHLMLIWLLASQTNNEIPNDAKYLQNLLNLDERPNLKELIEKGFLVFEHDASEVLAECKQVAMPETETETETEYPSSGDDGDTDSAFAEFWEAYPKKVEKKKSETAFRRLTKTKQLAALSDIRAGRFDGKQRQYIPNPTTYIHGERWNDEADSASPARSAKFTRGSEV